MVKRLLTGTVLALLLVLAAACGEGDPDDIGLPSGVLLTEQPLRPTGKGAAFDLGDTVWRMDVGKGDAARPVLVWFQREGARLIPRLIDVDGYLDPRDILSPRESGPLAAEVLDRGREEAEARGLEASTKRHDYADGVVAANPDASAAKARLDRSAWVSAAYGQSGLLPAAFDLLPTRDGAVVQTRYGKLIILTYLGGEAQSGRLRLYSAPSALGMGSYFPDRPGTWTAVRRNVASVLPWMSPPLPRYKRAADLVPFGLADLADPSMKLDWPLSIVLKEGGRKGTRFLDAVGDFGWYAPDHVELRATTLAPPTSINNVDFLAAHLRKTSR
ncbi:hypothetical protein [Brevundimonas diminuta]|uniref:hypothetical protein n=1 Tax=Brevundimonas diminuta TaxID=293 RepID=UPI003CFD3C48